MIPTVEQPPSMLEPVPMLATLSKAGEMTSQHAVCFLIFYALCPLVNFRLILVLKTDEVQGYVIDEVTSVNLQTFRNTKLSLKKKWLKLTYRSPVCPFQLINVMIALSIGIVSVVAHPPAHLTDSVLGAISNVLMDVTVQMVSVSWRKPCSHSWKLASCDLRITLPHPLPGHPGELLWFSTLVGFGFYFGLLFCKKKAHCFVNFSGNLESGVLKLPMQIFYFIAYLKIFNNLWKQFQKKKAFTCWQYKILVLM